MSSKGNVGAGWRLVSAVVVTVAMAACGAVQPQDTPPKPAPQASSPTPADESKPSQAPAGSVHAEHMEQKPGADQPAPPPERHQRSPVIDPN